MLNSADRNFFEGATASDGFLQLPQKKKGNIILLTCGDHERFPEVYARQKGTSHHVHVMALPGMHLLLADKRTRDIVLDLLDEVSELTGFDTFVPLGQWPCRAAKKRGLTLEENIQKMASGAEFLMRAYAERRCVIIPEFCLYDGRNTTHHGLNVYHPDIRVLIRPRERDFSE